MIGFIFKLLLLCIIVYAVAYVIKGVLGFARTLNTNTKKAMGSIEVCPACNQGIQVTGDDMVCPRCGTNLGRNKEGKLLIKVN